MAAPRILASNRTLVTTILEEVKGAEIAGTPLGPGHFGEHGRDTVKIEVESHGVETTGKLKAAVQLFWREYGTGSRYRNRRNALRSYVASFGGTGGEAPRMTANKALNYAKRFIRFYYGGMANWWRL